jgi:hypothetical protein
VSWPLASFVIVAGVLIVGWLAYERARPSARMVAVVATLAAVAALGRDAFVALPDVKPITAIAFVVGYALGPLPGFTVGAIGMLASNMMLGQGPYTPWQMAAWGLVGLAGALLGRVRGDGAGGQGDHERVHVDAWCRPHAGCVPADSRPRAAVRHHRHRCQLSVRARVRP